MLFSLYYLNLCVLWDNPVAYVAHISHGSKETAKNITALFLVFGEVTSEDATLHEMFSMETGSGPYFLALSV